MMSLQVQSTEPTGSRVFILPLKKVKYISSLGGIVCGGGDFRMSVKQPPMEQPTYLLRACACMCVCVYVCACVCVCVSACVCVCYGSETWVPSSSHVKRMQGFVMWCLRVILGVTKWDKKLKHRATVNGWH